MENKNKLQDSKIYITNLLKAILEERRNRRIVEHGQETGAKKICRKEVQIRNHPKTRQQTSI